MTSDERKTLNLFMTALADGDRSAFQQVFDLAWPAVKRYASKSLTNPLEAEDVAQEAFIKAFKQAPSFDPTKDALTWLLTLTTYECLTYNQKLRRRREDYSPALMRDIPSTHDDPEQESFRNKLETAVNDVLSGLCQIERTTILAAIFGEERPDIAAATFRKRLQRSLAKFRSIWEAKYDNDY